MPNHYFLHKLQIHPRFHHIKRRLSHFTKMHPKARGGTVANRGLHQIQSNNYSDPGMHILARGIHQYKDPGMHTVGCGVHHRKKLHPLKFKI
jgi:hypothetical protein